jgi:hypothetical protein
VKVADGTILFLLYHIGKRFARFSFRPSGRRLQRGGIVFFDENLTDYYSFS